MTLLKVLILIALVPSVVWAQERMTFSLDPGIYTYHSENSMKTIGDKAIDWAPGFSIAFHADSLWGLQSPGLEYSYTRAFAKNAMQFTSTGPSGPEDTHSFGGDLILSNHTIDLSAAIYSYKWITFSAGPAASFGFRTIRVKPPEGNNLYPFDLEDRLASLCLGVNGSFSLEIPLQSGSQYLFFSYDIKLRYLQSVWFDARGRNLENYHQRSLLARMGFGIGYAF